MSTSEDTRDRSHLRPVPPTGTWGENDDDAERAVLGALLTAGNPTPGTDAHELLTEVIDALNPGDFHQPRHEQIYDAILTTHYAGHPLEPLVVADRLNTSGDLGRIGGRAYLHDLVSPLPSLATTPYYARIVTEHAGRRVLREAARKLLHLADHADARHLADQALVEIRRATDRVTPTSAVATSTWAITDLTDVLAHGDTSPRPTVLTRRDGPALLYPGAIHSISGEPGSGKSWVAVLAVAQEVTAGRPALYVDFEDRAHTLVARLRDLAVPDALIAAHVRYIRPQTAIDELGRAHLLAAATDCHLAIIDGVTEAMGLHGLSLTDNEDVARFLALLPHYVADAGPAVLQIDHVVKDADSRGRYAIGGQHKLAGITGAAFKAIVAKPMSRGTKGMTRIVIDKDRHGRVGPSGTTVAELTLDATELHPDTTGGTAYAWLDTPIADHAPDGTWRPTALMEKVSRYLEVNPGATGNGIQDVVRGKREHIRSAVQALIADGLLRTEPGANRSTHHYMTEPYREAESR